MERSPRLLAAALIVGTVTLVGALFALAATSVPPVVLPTAEGSVPTAFERTPHAPSGARTASPSRPPVHAPGPPWEGWRYIGIALGLAVAAVLIWLAARALNRLMSRLRTPTLDAGQGVGGLAAELPPEVAAERAVSSALDELSAGDLDADAAIVRCWRTVEAAGAEAGVVRSPRDTATSYAARLAAVTGVDTAALGELSSLYTRAVYAPRGVTLDRATAVACLERLLPGLERP